LENILKVKQEWGRAGQKGFMRMGDWYRCVRGRFVTKRMSLSGSDGGKGLAKKSLRDRLGGEKGFLGIKSILGGDQGVNASRPLRESLSHKKGRMPREKCTEKRLKGMPLLGYFPWKSLK